MQVGIWRVSSHRSQKKEKRDKIKRNHGESASSWTGRKFGGCPRGSSDVILILYYFIYFNKVWGDLVMFPLPGFWDAVIAFRDTGR